MAFLSKNLAHRTLNAFLWGIFCLLAGSGYLLAFRLPHGKSGHGLDFFGLSRHEWGDIHFWAGSFFVGAVALHLALNRAWLVKIGAGNRRVVLWLVLAAGLGLLAAFLWAPLSG